jgi:hypothetical protein
MMNQRDALTRQRHPGTHFQCPANSPARRPKKESKANYCKLSMLELLSTALAPSNLNADIVTVAPAPRNPSIAQQTTSTVFKP